MKASENTRPAETSESWIHLVEEKVASTRFGMIQIVVHEGRVIQIERTEKLRLPVFRATPLPEAS